MKEVQEKGRICGMGGAPKPEGAAGGCGVRDGAAVPSAGSARRGTGFRIRPMRAGHRRSLDCALKMGHCAPAVMAALVGDDDPGRDSAVLLASAMAGGIGNTGCECGALTSSILHLGERYGREAGPDGVPLSIALARRVIGRFGQVHGGLRCDEIRRGGTNPLPCMRAMVSAPEIMEEVIADSVAGGRDAVIEEGAGLLLSAFGARQFHCVHTVFSGLDGIVPECDRLKDMTYPFVGGLALSGGTCSAAAAGVLAIGLATGRIENSYGRVMAMMMRMFYGGDMMRDDVNHFNAAINRGQVLMEWFADAYGASACAGLTGIAIGRPETVERYVSGGGVGRCEAIAAAVAGKTREIIGDRG
jgi:C_GCAxxG_C_C family probable redox protein